MAVPLASRESKADPRGEAGVRLTNYRRDLSDRCLLTLTDANSFTTCDVRL
jgi:hypothetical protein